VPQLKSINLDDKMNKLEFEKLYNSNLLFGTGADDPGKFEDVWDHFNYVERNGWREAIKKELAEMQFKKQIWKQIPITSVPKDKKLIRSKWETRKRKMESSELVYVLLATFRFQEMTSPKKLPQL
jgi:hypothetical protein